MKIRFTPPQVAWLKKVTGTNTAQEAVDFFADCMKKEGINPTEIMDYLNRMITVPLPPEFGED